MEQVLMDIMLGFFKERQNDGRRFFTYYAPFSIHKRWAQQVRTLLVTRRRVQIWPIAELLLVLGMRRA
jgi:hypothetical protein